MRGSGVRWLWEMALVSRPRLDRGLRWARGRRSAVLTAAVLLAGCVTAACALGLPDRAAAAVGFGVSIGVLATATVMVLAARLDRVGFDAGAAAGIVLLAAWTVVATAWTLPAGAASWIAFADGLGYLVLALAILLRQVLHTEHVVHVLEVRELRTR